MGSAFSRRSPAKEEERRRREMEQKFGVLVPPSFVMTSSSSPSTMPISCLASLKAANSPSLMHYLWTTNAGNRLLKENLNPGIWLSVGGMGGDSSTYSRNVLVALDTTSSDHGGEYQPPDPTASPSLLWAGITSFDELSSLDLRVPTQGVPSLRGLYRVGPGSISSQLQANGKGWIGAQWNSRLQSRERNGDDDLNYIMGGWLDIDVAQAATLATKTNPFELFTNHQKQVLTWAKSSSSSASSSFSRIAPSFHFYGAAEWLQSMAAVEARAPFSDFSSASVVPPLLSTMVSLDIANATKGGLSESEISKEPSSAPLWLSLQSHNVWFPEGSSPSSPLAHSKPKWALNLSQILTFDRPVYNIMEERAPYIRQTFGWVVQVESKSKNDTSDNKASAASASMLSLGATWQINRGLAVKAVVKDTSLKYGLILRRWAQPRVTVSILQTCDLQRPTSHKFLGFGIEIDTSTDRSDDLLLKTEYNDDSRGKPLDARVPETKIQLPSQTAKVRSGEYSW